MPGTWIDDATLRAIEADLDAAHRSLGARSSKKGAAYGDFAMGNLEVDSKMAMPSSSELKSVGIRMLEGIGPAFAFGFLNAKNSQGEVKIGPMPLDLGLGVGLLFLDLFGMVPGRFSDDAVNVSMSLLAGYGARAGANMGYLAGNPPPSSTPTTPGSPYTTPTSTSGMPDIVGSNRVPLMRNNVAGVPNMTGQVAPPGTKRFYIKRA